MALQSVLFTQKVAGGCRGGIRGRGNAFWMRVLECELAKWEPDTLGFVELLLPEGEPKVTYVPGPMIALRRASGF